MYRNILKVNRELKDFKEKECVAIRRKTSVEESKETQIFNSISLLLEIFCSPVLWLFLFLQVWIQDIYLTLGYPDFS